jgi:hypothetical protein
MRQSQIYLCRDLVVEGTPMDKEDFEELSGRKVARSEDDAYFLQIVRVLGQAGVLVEVDFLILERSAVSGVGRGHVRVPSDREAREEGRS